MMVGFASRQEKRKYIYYVTHVESFFCMRRLLTSIMLLVSESTHKIKVK